MQFEFASDRRGGVILIGALAVSVLALFAAFGIEAATAALDKAALQEAADAAALHGAKELTLASKAGVAERSRALALGRLDDEGQRAQTAATARLVDEDEGVNVRLVQTRPSLFQLLTRRPVVIAAEATAMRLGSVPLCVLAHGEDGSALKLRDSAPATKLVITGSGQIAEHSDWTVMVAKALEVRGSPTLVINARYAESRVPVPPGAGPPDDVRLSR